MITAGRQAEFSRRLAHAWTLIPISLAVSLRYAAGMAETQKTFLLKLDDSAHERLAAAAARAGVSMQAYARDAIDAAAQEDDALALAAQALSVYGEAFGLDPAGNARKIAE